MKRLKRFFLLIAVLAIAVIAGYVWLSHQRTVASGLAALAQKAAINGASTTLQAGPTPADWPVRGFIPASVLKATVDLLSGAQVVIPVGRPKDGHVNGYVRFTVKSAKLAPEDMKMGVQIDGVAKYEADLVKVPFGVSANLAIDAILMPSAQFGQNGVLWTQFRIVPNAIAVMPGWMGTGPGTNGLLAEMLADQAKVYLGNFMVISVPAISPPIEVDPSVKSSSFQPFRADGGTNIVLSMTRPARRLNISFERWLATRSGIWLLGGKSVTTPIESQTLTSPSSEELENSRAALIEKLAPYQKTDDQVEFALPATKLTDFVNQLLLPTPININFVTSGTSGLIDKEIIKAKGLGDLGLEVRPHGDDFGVGTLSINPQTAVWSSLNGISVSTLTRATASVNLDLHLDTGIGGGLGSALKLDAQGDAEVPIQVKFEKRSTERGSAILLQPSVPCSPVVIKAQPGTTPVWSLPWIVVSPIGMEFKGELGGTQISPFILMDNFPIVIAAPAERDSNGNTLKQDPEKVIILFKHPFIGLTFSPNEVTVNDSGIVVTANATFVSRDSDATDAERAKRSELRDALKASAVAANCNTITALKIVGGDVTMVDLYKEAEFVVQNTKDHILVTQDVWNALTDLARQNPTKLPSDLQKAFTDSVKVGTETLQHSLQHVVDQAIEFEKQAKQSLPDPSHPLTPPRPPDPVGGGAYDWARKQGWIPSDSRLKRNIERVGILENGIPLYRFRYRWSEQIYVGVLAQDVERVSPSAVSKFDNGYLGVNYDQLGLKLLKWQDWIKSRTEKPSRIGRPLTFSKLPPN